MSGPREEMVRRGNFAVRISPPLVLYRGQIVPMVPMQTRFLYLLVERQRVHEFGFVMMQKENTAPQAVKVTMCGLRRTLNQVKPGLGDLIRNIRFWGYELIDEEEVEMQT